MKPSFIIIGGVKCASSSLYRYLNEHPQVLPCKTKEPGYFNQRNPLKLIKGYRKYINLFPKLNEKEFVADWLEIGEDLKMEASTFTKKIEAGSKYITGEASATTFVFANPILIKVLFPKIRIILSLRNPTKRYISHFNMYKRFEKEGRKGHVYGEIEDYINREISEFEKGNPTKILHQGCYINYLPKWKKTFGDQFKLIFSHQLNGETALGTLDDITSFLGLEHFDYSDALSKKHNVSPKATSNSDAEAILNSFYQKYNDELYSRYQISV